MLAMNPVVLSFATFCILVFASASAAETADFVVSTQGNDSGRARWPSQRPTSRTDRWPPSGVPRTTGRTAEERACSETGRSWWPSAAAHTSSNNRSPWGPRIPARKSRRRSSRPTATNALSSAAAGGLPVGKWAADGRWRVELPDVKAGKWNFAQLFVNDTRRYRPRLPKQGYYQIAGNSSRPRRRQARAATSSSSEATKFAPTGPTMSDVEVIPFHEWAISRMHVAAVNPDDHRVVFTGHTLGLSQWAAFRKGYRYFVENVREALGEPGQWYLDRPAGMFTYIPLPGEDADQDAVVSRPRSGAAAGCSRATRPRSVGRNISSSAA